MHLDIIQLTGALSSTYALQLGWLTMVSKLLKIKVLVDGYVIGIAAIEGPNGT